MSSLSPSLLLYSRMCFFSLLLLLLLSLSFSFLHPTSLPPRSCARLLLFIPFSSTLAYPSLALVHSFFSPLTRHITIFTPTKPHILRHAKKREWSVGEGGQSSTSPSSLTSWLITCSSSLPSLLRSSRFGPSSYCFLKILTCVPAIGTISLVPSSSVRW